MRRVFKNFALLALSFTLFAPVQAFANTNAEVRVSVPVSVAATQDSADVDYIQTLVKIEPIGEAPMPAQDTVAVTGAQDVNFGDIVFTTPGDYYYRIEHLEEDPEDPYEGLELNTDPYILRVCVYNADDGGLTAVMFGYKSQHNAIGDVGDGSYTIGEHKADEFKFTMTTRMDGTGDDPSKNVTLNPDDPLKEKPTDDQKDPVDQTIKTTQTPLQAQKSGTTTTAKSKTAPTLPSGVNTAAQTDDGMGWLVLLMGAGMMIVILAGKMRKARQ